MSHFFHHNWKVFDFDDIHWSYDPSDAEDSYASQEDVFASIGVPVVEQALAGISGLCVAYGQTGSGKVFFVFGVLLSGCFVPPARTTYLSFATYHS
jgi:hypothetical protein